MSHRSQRWLALLVLLAGCNYFKLARPNVIGQLHPDLVGLVNFLPSIDHPNEATLGRLIGTGGLAHAERDSAGFMRARVRVPRDQFIWRPSVVVMPEAATSASTSRDSSSTWSTFFGWQPTYTPIMPVGACCTE
jgi:hypothetical protein